ncbi:MAG: pilus assembly PilX N-terminal domain-containing protein [Mesotoga sp.]|nr:pilus assembly PilX N-terminal domain-containing protein [Mesotoga sp.]
MNRKSGIILGIALIMFLVISILGAALMTIVMGQAKQANDLEKRTQAFFLARSGVEIAREYVNKIDKDDLENKILVLYGNLRDDDDHSYDFNIQDVTSIWSNNIRASFEASSSSFRNYEVVTAIWKDDSFTNYISSGNAGDMSRTVAFKCIEASEGIPVFDMAVFADKYVELTGSSKILGDVGINATIFTDNQQGIKLAWSTEISEDALVGVGATPTTSVVLASRSVKDNIKGVLATLDSQRTYIKATFPDKFPVLDPKGSLSTDWANECLISEDGYYETIRLHGNRIIEIDTGAIGNIRRIVVDNTSFEQGKIILLGEGILEMYVRNFSSENFLQGDTQFNCKEVKNKGKTEYVGDSERLRIFYEGSKELKISGNARIKGILHSNKSNIFVGGSNAFYGLIVSGGQRVEISGDCTADVIAIYAPEAELFLAGSSSIYGAVVCRKFHGMGNVRVNYHSDISNIFPPQTIGIIDTVTVTATELWGE